MPGENQSYSRDLFTSERCDEVVAANVRVNNVDSVLDYQPRNLAGGLQVEGVSKRHLVPRSNHTREQPSERTVWPYRKMNGVAAAGETPHQIGDVNLPTADIACRANLEDFHEGLRKACANSMVTDCSSDA